MFSPQKREFPETHSPFSPSMAQAQKSCWSQVKSNGEDALDLKTKLKFRPILKERLASNIQIIPANHCSMSSRTQIVSSFVLMQSYAI